jgi:hypothetical protein
MILRSALGMVDPRSTPTRLGLPSRRWGGFSYFYLLWRCSWLVSLASEQTVVTEFEGFETLFVRLWRKPKGTR